MKKYATINRFNFKPIDTMQTIIENVLNPLRYHLSDETKKRLRWMYIVKYECGGNISQAANKINISRPWLSQIHSHWQEYKCDPRSLEPESRAPHDTSRRKRISKKAENKIIAIRKKYKTWGKDKIARTLEREFEIKIGSTTVNRYLAKHELIDVKLSNKNKLAHQNKIAQKQKMRPPKEIKDFKPGALMEKDMKFIVKMGCFLNMEKRKAKENFWLQHTLIDSFTRIRALELVENGSSQTALTAQAVAEKRIPFAMACLNTDNGSENEKEFDEHLEKKDVVHFFSRSGTPTDNPRVERSHLTDDLEFYKQGNLKKTFKEQKKALEKWEKIYNYERPHQALGQLTPMEFYALWKKNPNEAYAIRDKYQKYLKKQSVRLATSRRIKKKEQIEKLMQQIDKKLANNFE